MTTNELDDDVAAYYERGFEDARLSERVQGRLEFARLTSILGRYLESGPRDVLDVGGGTGPYASWLAGRGHRVHLIDPVDLHVRQARERAGGRYSVEQGDARSLTHEASSTDAVLLFGPLYHLVEARERRRALEEALRVLRPGGLIFAIGISRWASLVDGLFHNLLDDPEFVAMVEEDIRSGVHRNPTRREGWFTTSYFHHPDELRNEVSDAGFTDVEVLAVQGFAHVLGDLEERLNDEARKETLLAAVARVESEPSMIGTTGHLIAVARKPAGSVD